jgi:Flp pilus assembly protein CpaB
MNPRQRRGVLLLAFATLGALAVFFTVLAYVGSVSAQVGDLRPVLRLAKPASAYEPITPDMLRVEQMPQKWAPAAALGDASEAVGLVAAADIPAGSLVQQGMLVTRPGIQRGYREVAILVDAETGVAGKVSSGDRVDIIMTTEDDKKRRTAAYLVTNALVIDVGVPAELAKDDRRGEFTKVTQAVPVTFALPLADALRLSYAESFAVKLRLALRGGGDDAPVPPSQRLYVPRSADRLSPAASVPGGARPSGESP